MLKGFLSAVACLLMLSGTPASAASRDATPSGTVQTTSASVPIMLAQRFDRDDRRRMQDGRRHDRRDRWRGRHSGPRRDFRGPPPGWRRYQARPRGWQTRGCMQIGPIWYCP
ncbi:hypothetical protein PQJ75_01050 [Rhodoplanes sp. TEM]|uniref:Uncharacterized protein n=1 Tax=Rhodoplanes tepidamans TaxID=200616 RepID=A0ABT5J5C7_RHOTP|nr:MULTISPECIES: hypothetical protein [Rhodoplanes]MDC7784839.1 hypothetical protein [Rhodoplanes tepidamans]MDC7982306.1 hypothetical protein [Rhodoplanes sp. TEM]MDQ0356315.1 hypothetical protein [Rhodoplanes tepidamans]